MIPSEPHSINRAVVVVQPKQPFVDWLMQCPEPPEDITLDSLQDDCTTYLIPDFEDLDSLDDYLEALLPFFAATEFDSWYSDETLWPKLSTDDYPSWFDLKVHSTVIDMADGPIKQEKL